MSDSQWPLSAAATGMLLALPGADAKPRRLDPKDTDPVKLALKELLVRGAFTMSVTERRFGRNHVTLGAGDMGGVLPAPLSRLRAALAPRVPGELKEVLRQARASNQNLVRDIGTSARDELSDRGLIEEHEVKRLGLFPARAWGRTASGDAWARTGREHLDRLRGLEVELERDRDGAAEAAMAAGALAVMVPAAMAPIAQARDRRRQAHGGDGGGGHGAGGDGSDGSFDVFDGIGNLIDQGIDSVDGAFDSVVGAIDGAIDSGVDAGGGDFGGGGDGGGGGGDGGGGGG